MIPATPRRPRCRAFTLMELLIAVMAFAIVLAAMNGVLFSALRLRNKAIASIDQNLPLERALAVIRKDLANIVPPGGLLSGSLQTTPTGSRSLQDQTSASNSRASSMSANALGSQPGQRSPEFFTTTGMIDLSSPWAEVQRVAYFLAQPTNATPGNDLFRSTARNLLPSVEEPPFEEPLLSGVERIDFLYLKNAQWQDTWDSTTEDVKLPKAIKVQITLAPQTHGLAQPLPIELIVSLLVDGGSNNLAQASGGAP